jgi:hypothetical protein
MKRLDYIFPMLVGVLAFVNFLWMMSFPYYDIGLVSLCISMICIAIAIIERNKYYNHH